MMAKPRRVTRDAKSGRFVPTIRAKIAPTLTVTEMVPVRQPTKRIIRDVKTGQFTLALRARTAPTRTVTESVPR